MHPVASGDYGDVYEGLLNGSRVCVKRPQIYGGKLETVKEVRCKRDLSLITPLTKPSGNLPRGHQVETSDASKHRSLPGRHSRTSSAHFNLDFWRGTEGIYFQSTSHGPARPCGCPRSLVSGYPYALPSYVVSLTVSITSTPVTWSMAISRGCVLV